VIDGLELVILLVGKGRIEVEQAQQDGHDHAGGSSYAVHRNHSGYEVIIFVDVV
jgi:hypothetical protein